MQPTEFNDSFKLFPYRKDYEDGRTNNGGIDLSREPWRIAEITEAKDFPELLHLIKEFNKNSSPFLTLGCEASFDEGLMHGYVEFTLKDDNLANDLSFIAELDENFYAWARKIDPELESTLRNVLAWEYTPFSYHGESQKHKVSFFFRAPDQDYAGKTLNVVRTYFCETLAKTLTDAPSL
ncbi:hypothetical protein ACLSSQ_10600 [Azospira sp. APE16]|uniref:hypothetical protein n=1 Tax=Azospira sp. APE16 TaxID=3394231 RepID=UPI003A4D5D2B